MYLNNPLKVACLLAISTTTLAQDNHQNDDTESLNKLIVTAGLNPIAIDQFGGTVTTITAADIQATQATYLSDILRQVPGFAINQSGGPGTQTQLRVRGAEANHVLVMRDGVRLNDASAGDEYLFNYGLTNNIERIEIIRGPQSAIWGTDAVSAVINIITREASDNQITAATEVGSFNSKSLDFAGEMNQQNWHLNAGIKAVDSAGTNISRNGSEADGYENYSSHFKWGLDLNNGVQLALNLNHNNAMNEFDATDFISTGLPVDADLWTDRQHSTASFAVDLAFTEDWHNQLQYHWTDTNAQNHAFGLGETSATSSTSHEFKMNSSVYFDADHHNRLSVAGDHRQIDFSQTGEASPFGDPNQQQSYHVTGLAIEYHQQTTDQFSWNVSARLDDFNRFEDVSNYRLAASYRINDGLRFRGSWGTGSKAPSFIERFGFFPANFIGNPDLQPEESDAFELAVIKTWQQSNLELVYFDQDLENEINGFVFDADSGLFTADNLNNQSKRSGLEVNWNTWLDQAVELNFNYTYTDADETSVSGEQLTEVRRPKHMAYFSLNYPFFDDQAQLFTQVNYVGEQLDVFFDPTNFVSSQQRLSAYTTVDVTLNWRFNPRWHAYLKAKNILDEDYEEVLGYARPGAQVAVGVKVVF